MRQAGPSRTSERRAAVIKDSAASQEAVAVPGVSGLPGPELPRGSNPPSSPVKIPRCGAPPTAMRDYGMCSNSSLRTRSRSALCGKSTLSRLVIRGCVVEWQGVRPPGSGACAEADERRRIRLRGCRTARNGRRRGRGARGARRADAACCIRREIIPRGSGGAVPGAPRAPGSPSTLATGRWRPACSRRSPRATARASASGAEAAGSAVRARSGWSGSSPSEPADPVDGAPAECRNRQARGRRVVRGQEVGAGRETWSRLAGPPASSRDA